MSEQPRGAGLTREDIQKHAGYLIKSRREDLRISVDDFMQELGIASRKSLWTWETGAAWPRPRYLSQIEELLGFRRNSLQELFRLEGFYVDITEMKPADIVEPRWERRKPENPLAQYSEAALVQELTRRIFEKDEEIAGLRRAVQKGGRS